MCNLDLQVTYNGVKLLNKYLAFLLLTFKICNLEFGIM
jgi:hypothetical protein